MGEVTVSAKDKKKSKTERDKRSEVRTGSDKDKEALEWAIKQSQAEDRRRLSRHYALLGIFIIPSRYR